MATSFYFEVDERTHVINFPNDVPIEDYLWKILEALKASGITKITGLWWTSTQWRESAIEDVLFELQQVIKEEGL